MKNKTMFIFAGLLAVIMIIVACIVMHKVDVYLFNKKMLKTNDEKRLEVAEYNSRIYELEENRDWWEAKAKLQNDKMKVVVDLSYQDPAKNEEYDMAWEEWVETLPDLPIDDEVITREIERKDSTDFFYEADKYTLSGELFYNYPYQNNKPSFYIRWNMSDERFKPRNKYSVNLYAGYKAGTLTFNYHIFDWLSVGVLEHVQVIKNDFGKEETIFSSEVGIGINIK